jgi:hypothetical protein
MAAYGVVLGGVVVIAAVFVLKAAIFGIRIDDPLPFLFSTGIVASFAALACFFPGWRATLVTPMVAIRDDPGSIWRSARRGALDLVERVSNLIPGSARELSDEVLLEEFVDSSRHAESLRQAIQLSLEALREAVNSVSVRRAVAGAVYDEVHFAGGGVAHGPVARISVSAAADARRSGCVAPLGFRETGAPG